jgi:hypothetical protein
MTQVKVYDIDKEAVFEQSIVIIKNCFFIFLRNQVLSSIWLFSSKRGTKTCFPAEGGETNPYFTRLNAINTYHQLTFSQTQVQVMVD